MSHKATETPAASATVPILSEPVVSQVILKIAQRCNLNCTYCYVYNRGDSSWQTRPAFISERVIIQLARRIKEHCYDNRLNTFTVELHGGEPLLFGKERTQRLIDTMKRESEGLNLRFVLQTNGLLLDEGWISLFAQNQVSFGVSLDGPPEIADRRRVRRSGGGSTQELLEILSRLRTIPEFEDLFGGCLCVIDPQVDGGALVRWFVENGFNSFDLLLPDGNRANLPEDWAGAEPYKRFLLEAFEAWYSMGERAPRIRMFEQMIFGKFGQRSGLDALGGDLRRLCVVESDGSIGVVDTARMCGGDLSHDVLDVFSHPLSQHVEAYGIMSKQSLCNQCVSCKHRDSCGGGYLPHRFDGITFDQPSLYCEALFALSERINEKLRHDMPAEVWTTTSAYSTG